MVYNSLSSEVK